MRWEAGKMREELKKQLKKQGTSTGENEESVKIAEEKILDYGGEWKNAKRAEEKGIELRQRMRNQQK